MPRRLKSPRNAIDSAAKATEEEDEEDIIEMSATSTIVCILMLLSIGASMMSSYIMLHNPDCLGTNGSSSSGVRGKSNAITYGNVAVPNKAAAPAVPKPDHWPAKCTEAQNADVLKQLTVSGCAGAPWTQSCSTTKATVKGCQDVHWVKEFFATQTYTTDKPFTALFVGGQTVSPEYVEFLQLGSHSTSKYDVDKYRSSFTPDKNAGCSKSRKAISTFKPEGEQPAKLLVIAPDSAVATQLKTQRDKSSIPETAWMIKNAKAGSFHIGPEATTVDKVVEGEKEGFFKSLAEDSPIHYMKIEQNGADYDVMMGSPALLKRVWYLDFDFNWSGDWKGKSLEDLIFKRLVKRNMVCYWNGIDGKYLWRITDCWQDHFKTPTWSKITCVNLGIPETKPVFESMEKIFEETLKTPNLVF